MCDVTYSQIRWLRTWDVTLPTTPLNLQFVSLQLPHPVLSLLESHRPENTSVRQSCNFHSFPPYSYLSSSSSYPQGSSGPICFPGFKSYIYFYQTPSWFQTPPSIHYRCLWILTFHLSLFHSRRLPNSMDSSHFFQSLSPFLTTKKHLLPEATTVIGRDGTWNKMAAVKNADNCS